MLAMILVAVIGGVPATASPHTGEPISGELISMDSTGLVLKTADGAEKKLTLASLRGIKIRPADSVKPEPHLGPVVELIDGSKLHASAYASTGGKATIGLKQGPVTTSTRNVRSVLLRSQRNLPKLQIAWREMIDAERQGDMAVVRRTRTTEGERVEHSLDQLEGVLYDITSEQVEFGLDGEKRKVPVSKLEGVVYYHAQQKQSDEPVARFHTNSGAEIAASSIATADGKLKITTVASVEVSIPLTDLASVEFSGGDVVYLSDMKPESSTWRPYIPTRIGGDRLRKLYEPRMDQANDGGKLRLEPGGDVYEKGLAVHSRTELIYRLPAAFARFQADVGLDPRFRDAGDVELVLKSEKDELFRRRLNPKNPRMKVDVKIVGVRRLTILVDFGDGWDVADYLNLCDARVSK